MLAQPAAPGRLRHFAGAGSMPVTLADCLISPSGLAYDPSTETLYVAEIFTGRIMKISVQ
jgi:sugar lactone lactonase YvrE